MKGSFDRLKQCSGDQGLLYDCNTGNCRPAPQDLTWVCCDKNCGRDDSTRAECFNKSYPLNIRKPLVDHKASIGRKIATAQQVAARSVRSCRIPFDVQYELQGGTKRSIIVDYQDGSAAFGLLSLHRIRSAAAGGSIGINGTCEGSAR